MDNKKMLTFTLFIFTITTLTLAQTITKQFQETKYNIKGFCMIDSVTGWAVGGKHWDLSEKKNKSTILKTSDAGENWSVQNCDIDNNLWDVHFINKSKGWAVGDSGYIITTDNGGENWIQQAINTSFNFKSVYFTDTLNGWVVANEPIHYHPSGEVNAWKGNIWHTSDGGATWRKQTAPSDIGIIHRIYFQNNLRGWAVGVKNHSIDVFVDTYCTAYYTEDGGQTWIEKFNPELNLVFTDINFVDEKHGWIVGFQKSSGEPGGCVFQTSDGGNNWQRIIDDRFHTTLWQVEFVDSLNGYIVGADYIAAWGPPVFRTMNGGETWQKIRMEKHNLMGLYGLAVSNDKVLAIGDKGYVVTSTDPWGDMGQYNGVELFAQKLINDLYEFEDVFFFDKLKGWVVGKKSLNPQDWGQVILHTNDGGKNWTEQYFFDLGNLPAFAFRLDAVQFISATKGWAVGNSNNYGDNLTTGILFTDSGGQTWTQQAQDVSDGEIVDLHFLNELNGWALTNKHIYPDGFIQILKTIDGGNSWEMINTGQNGLVSIGYAIKSGKIFFQDLNIGWILGARNVLLKTTDGGVNWSSIVLPDKYTNTYSLSFSNQQNGYICGARKNFRTADGGENWNEQHLSDVTFTDLCFPDSLQGWMVGESGLVFHTEDGGITWNLIENSVSVAALKSVSFVNKNYGWATGRSGTILKIDNSNPTTVLDKNNEVLPYSFNLSQNYPNPFNPLTTISYALPKAGKVEITVYDIRGRIVKTLLDTYKEPGRYTVRFDGKQLSSGLYIYRLKSGDFITQRKMLLVK